MQFSPARRRGNRLLRATANQVNCRREVEIEALVRGSLREKAEKASEKAIDGVFAADGRFSL